MELGDFIQNFADQFDDTDASTFTAETNFKQLEEWSSLMALSIISMIDEEYNVRMTGNDIRGTSTIGELFNIVKGRI
ncbi:MAG: phosphopantetheine-binding protein [Bacteroidia bacterium]|nr:phosphopantetheine-binding protein [Bacteroidia bacterium]